MNYYPPVSNINHPAVYVSSDYKIDNDDDYQPRYHRVIKISMIYLILLKIWKHISISKKWNNFLNHQNRKKKN